MVPRFRALLCSKNYIATGLEFGICQNDHYPHTPCPGVGDGNTGQLYVCLDRDTRMPNAIFLCGDGWKRLSAHLLSGTTPDLIVCDATTTTTSGATFYVSLEMGNVYVCTKEINSWKLVSNVGSVARDVRYHGHIVALHLIEGEGDGDAETQSSVCLFLSDVTGDCFFVLQPLRQVVWINQLGVLEGVARHSVVHFASFYTDHIHRAAPVGLIPFVNCSSFGSNCTLCSPSSRACSFCFDLSNLNVGFCQDILTLCPPSHVVSNLFCQPAPRDAEVFVVSVPTNNSFIVFITAVATCSALLFGGLLLLLRKKLKGDPDDTSSI
jgi:hypothetical protein